MLSKSEIRRANFPVQELRSLARVVTLEMRGPICLAGGPVTLLYVRYARPNSLSDIMEGRLFTRLVALHKSSVFFSFEREVELVKT